MKLIEKIRAAFIKKATQSLPDKIKINDTEAADKLIFQGNQLEDSEDYQAAMNLYEQAIEVAPQYAKAYLNKGNLLLAIRHYDQSIQFYLKALLIQPNYPFAYFNLGNAQQQTGQFDLALISYEKALSQKSDFADAWVAHGNVLGDLNKYDLAIESYKKAITLNPQYAQVYRNLGSSLYTLGRLEEAKNNFLHANSLAPSLDNYCDISSIYRETGAIERAIETARQACIFDSTSAGAHSLLLFCLGHSPSITRKDFFEEHLAFGKKFDQPEYRINRFSNEKNPHRILKLGIISADLRNHAVASFFEPLYELLLKTPSVVLYIYDNGDVDDAVSRRMKAIATYWISSTLLSDVDLEKRIHEDVIDVLIDLSGHTPAHRLPVFSRKPAPIQMSWIGYPGTTGLSAIDYYIGDRHYLPPGEFDDIFVEKILRLPATAPFNFSHNLPDINILPALGNGYITFGSFNRLDKISKEVINLWAKLLIVVPNSKILIAGLPITGDFSELLDWFDSFGVSSDRITLHHRSDMYNYLLLHHKIDVCLDTFPYCGSTTTCHALSMGVPTITLVGDMPISASGRAILSQLNLADLFSAHDQADFLEKGIWCAQHVSELAELRSTMRSRFTQSNLMKPEIIVKGLEFGMRHAWQRWCEDVPAESFEVVQSDDDFQIVHQ